MAQGWAKTPDVEELMCSSTARKGECYGGLLEHSRAQETAQEAEGLEMEYLAREIPRGLTLTRMDSDAIWRDRLSKY